MRVGVLGAGFMGSVHVAGWQTVPDAVVETVFAPSPERAAPLADSIGARHEANLDVVLTDPTLDVIDICLPSPQHEPVALAALAAGKHVLVEKPLALTVAAADRLVAASEVGPIMLVAQVLRFWPEYVAAHELVTSGALGTLRSGVATRRQAYPAWSALFTNPALTGGAVIDMLVHDFDALNWVFGQPSRVTARGRANPTSGGIDQAQVLIDYASGASALVDGGMEMPSSFPFGSRFELLGDAGALAYHFQAGGASFEEGTPTNTLTLYPGAGEAAVIDVPQVDPFAAEIAYFAGCVRAGVRPERVTVHDAWWALQVALAARQSIEAGGSVVTLPIAAK